jgi:tellurite resistance protein TerB
MALEWLKQRFNEVSTGLKAEVTKIRNKSFLEATVAGCVIVAHADGIVKPAKSRR